MLRAAIGSRSDCDQPLAPLGHFSTRGSNDMRLDTTPQEPGTPDQKGQNIAGEGISATATLAKTWPSRRNRERMDRPGPRQGGCPAACFAPSSSWPWSWWPPPPGRSPHRRQVPPVETPDIAAPHRRRRWQAGMWPPTQPTAPSSSSGASVARQPPQLQHLDLGRAALDRAAPWRTDAPAGLAATT
jgi:hypothetical protein